MQFLLTVPHDSAEEPTMASMDPADLEAALAAVEELNADLQKSGAFVFAGGLHPPSSAKTVDATGGEPVVADGPFVEGLRTATSNKDFIRIYARGFVLVTPETMWAVAKSPEPNVAACKTDEQQVTVAGAAEVVVAAPALGRILAVGAGERVVGVRSLERPLEAVVGEGRSGERQHPRKRCRQDRYPHL